MSPLEPLIDVITELSGHMICTDTLFTLKKDVLVCRAEKS